jgi:hypothetical protein
MEARNFKGHIISREQIFSHVSRILKKGCKENDFAKFLNNNSLSLSLSLTILRKREVITKFTLINTILREREVITRLSLINTILREREVITRLSLINTILRERLLQSLH